MPDTITLQVARYRPDTDSAPTMQEYEVPLREEWAVLDGLNYIKDRLDGTLSFRWSCRMGICGSCGMMVNGDPALTCGTFLTDYAPGPVRVEPLRELPRDPRPRRRDRRLHAQAADGAAVADPRRTSRPSTDGEFLQTPGEMDEYKQFSMCINCMLCYAACPVYATEPDFLGPAAIALAQRYNLDSRDQGAHERLDLLASPEGVWACTFVGECTQRLPQGRGPGRRHPALQAHRRDKDSAILPVAQGAAMNAHPAPARLYRPPVPRFWWLHRRSYLLFVLRELSSVFVAWFVVFLLLMVNAVHAGNDSYQSFLHWSGRPWVLMLNIVALAFVLLHAITWFNLAPKAMVSGCGESGWRRGRSRRRISPHGRWPPPWSAWIVLGRP